MSQVEAASIFPGKMLSEYCPTVQYDDTVDNFLGCVTAAGSREVMSAALSETSITPPGTEVKYRLFYVLASEEKGNKLPGSSTERLMDHHTAAPQVTESKGEAFRLHVATAADKVQNPPRAQQVTNLVPGRLELPIVTDFDPRHVYGILFWSRSQVKGDLTSLYRDRTVREIGDYAKMDILRNMSYAMSPVLTGVEYRFHCDKHNLLTKTGSRIFFSRHMLATADFVDRAIAEKVKRQKAVPDWMREAVKPDQRGVTAKNMAINLLKVLLDQQPRYV